MNKEILRTRLLLFALKIIKFSKTLPKTPGNIIIIKQLIRCSTSIGANYAEALFAHGKVDFIHIMVICRKEANETLYWLELLLKLYPEKSEQLNSLTSESTSILKIFISSVKTARKNSEEIKNSKS